MDDKYKHVDVLRSHGLHILADRMEMLYDEASLDNVKIDEKSVLNMVNFVTANGDKTTPNLMLSVTPETYMVNGAIQVIQYSW